MIPSSEKTLAKIARQTRVSRETLSETFGLHRRDLLFSDDYSIIIVPIFNDATILDVFSNINLIHFIRHIIALTDKIIVVLDRRNKEFNLVYKLFGHLYYKMFECKRYLELQKIAKQEKVTKFIYNKALDNNTIAAKTELGDKEFEPLHIDFSPNTYNHVDIPDRIGHFAISIESGLSLKRSISDLPSPKIVTDILSNAVIVDTTNQLSKQIGTVLGSKYYINIFNRNTIDHLVPFLGLRIFYHRTEFYNIPLFHNALSTRNKTIKKLKHISKKE